MEINEELMEVQLYLTVLMDGLTVNPMKFLSTITHELYHMTAQYTTKSVASVYGGCTDNLLAVYKKGGFNITNIHFNNEFSQSDGSTFSKTRPHNQNDLFRNAKTCSTS